MCFSKSEKVGSREQKWWVAGGSRVGRGWVAGGSRVGRGRVRANLASPGVFLSQI